MRRLSLWMRAHPMVGDSLIALHLLLIDVAILIFSVPEQAAFAERVDHWFLALLINLANVAPLVFRRKYPLAAGYTILVVGGVHAALSLGLSGAIASAIAVYSMVVYAGRRHGAAYLALMSVATIAQLAIEDEPNWAIIAVTAVLLLALSWALGEFAGARRAYHAEVEARLRLLETERDQATRIAVAEERSRIARELHDVVAHAVSVIVVNADGAKYAIRADPDLAERAVATISETGRSALDELRRLLDVLRNDTDRTDADPMVPQPDAGALTELAERVRAAGLPVTLTVGDLGVVPAGLSLGVYRIVQESLTNTLKHAGSGARADVRVWRTNDTVNVEIHDDGAGRAPALAATRDETAPSGGNGLIGMRERAHVYGGTLEAGPGHGGGWCVRGALPVIESR